MNHLKQRSKLTFPAHLRTPYSRPLSASCRPSTCNVSYGRTFAPAKPLNPRSSYLNQYEHAIHSTMQSHPPSFYDDANDSTFVSENYGPSTSGCIETFKNRPSEFRPRKSQPESKTLVPFQELETMSIGSVAEDVSRKTKLTKTTRETPADSFQIKVRENSLRIFSGSIPNLYQWSKLKEKFNVLFEVRAILEYVQPGKWSSEKILHLTDSKAGPRMQALYYEIDRPLPPLSVHSVVRCVGRLLARNRLHAFRVDQISEEERNDGQRLSFMCNRVVDELAASQQK